MSEVASEFDVSKMTISRWVTAFASALANGDADAKAAQEAEALRAVEAPGVVDPEDLPAELAAPELPEALDAIAETRRLLKDTRARGADAAAAGNHKIAQMCGRDAAALVVLLARLEKLHKADTDTLHISREELAAAFEGVIAKAAVICSRPLLCSRCNRELSVELSGKKQ